MDLRDDSRQANWEPLGLAEGGTGRDREGWGWIGRDREYLEHLGTIWDFDLT